MRIASVICEYNPFHNGHRLMLDEMRKNGASHIVACMSGNFTQRGDFAIFDKRTRAKTALLNGVDLVIEMPVDFACSGAERFAFGGVYILNALGCVDEICFGSECGNIDILQNVCSAVMCDEISEKIKLYSTKGLTFAVAREKAVRELFGSKVSGILSEPNNILAVEYLKALKKINSNIVPSTISRIGVSHDSTKAVGEIASASYIRKLIYQNNSEFLKYVPDNIHNILIKAKDELPNCERTEKLSNAFLYRLRMMTKEDFALLPDISEGLENRIYSAVRSALSPNDVIMSVKCKRYTHARIRRCILHAFLGINKNSLSPTPTYIRVLGFNEKGREILRIMRKKAELPIVMRYSDINSLSENCKKSFELESICDDIYALSGKNILECGKNYTENIIIL